VEVTTSACDSSCLEKGEKRLALGKSSKHLKGRQMSMEYLLSLQFHYF